MVADLQRLLAPHSDTRCRTLAGFKRVTYISRLVDPVSWELEEGRNRDGERVRLVEYAKAIKNNGT